MLFRSRRRVVAVCRLAERSECRHELGEKGFDRGVVFVEIRLEVRVDIGLRGERRELPRGEQADKRVEANCGRRGESERLPRLNVAVPNVVGIAELLGSRTAGRDHVRIKGKGCPRAKA